MGCHTWFYVCLPDKQEKWLNEWKKNKIKTVDRHIKSVNNLSALQIKNRIKELSNLYPNIITERFTIEQYKETVLKGDLKVKKMFDENLDILHIMKNCDQVDTCCTYGLYIIHDNKIYREMFASYPNGKPVFPDGLHDLFRIYDYEANACFNIDDCYTCLKEHNVTLSNSQDRDLKSFWNKYPDSIICFG